MRADKAVRYRDEGIFLPCRGTSDGKPGDGRGSSKGWKPYRGEVSNEREVTEDIEDDFRRFDIVDGSW